MKNSVPDFSFLYSIKIISNCHSKKNRIKEAFASLRKQYPYEVMEDQLYIKKGQKKNEYEVFVLAKPLEKKKERIKVLLLSCFVVIVILSGVLLNNSIVKNRKIESEKQKSLEKQMQEEYRHEEELNKRLSELEEKYNVLVLGQSESVYVQLKLLYQCLMQNTSINNISLEKNYFSVEAETKDSVKVLSNFEESKAFTNVKMIRTTVADNHEIVTFSGEFAKSSGEIDERLSIEDKISFYEHEIEEGEKIRNDRSQRVLSEYILELREKIHKSGCNEQYMQIKNAGEFTGVECFIESNSSGLLKLLESVQKAVISNCKIRNLSGQKNLQTTLFFDTGIKPGKDNDTDTYFIDLQEISSEELGSMFQIRKIASAQKQVYVTKRALAPAVEANIEPVKAEKSKSFSSIKMSYLGKTRKGDVSYILVKDDVFGIYYTLPLMDENTENESDFCYKTGNGYIARIRNEYYEVR